MGGGVRDLLLVASFKAAARSQSRRKHHQSERQSHVRLHHAVGSGSHTSGALRKWSIRSSGRPRSLSCAGHSLRAI